MLHRYWKYGEEDRWGKRREKMPEIKLLWEDKLQSIFDSQNLLPDLSDSQEEPISIGLDILGSGGGQWTLALTEHHICEITPGLPNDRPILTFDSEKLAESLEDQQLTNGKLHLFISNASSDPTDEQVIKNVTNAFFQTDLAK